MTGDATGTRLKVFVSYSRADIDFADQLVLALEDKGFDAILDRHDIDAAENWKERLGALIFSCDTVVFVLTDTSAASDICHWEVEEAARLGKRMIPVVPRPADNAPPPPALGELNYIYFYTTPAIPGSGFYDGVQKLTRALSVDLNWLREQTRLSEQAARWQARMERRDAVGNREASSMLLHGNVLAEALQWMRDAPKDAQVAPEILAFLDASSRAEAQRQAEAQAQLAEREAALAARVAADQRARRVTLAGIGIAALLLVLASWMGLTAANATHRAAENRAAVFAGEADVRFAQGRYAEAMLIALGGDPAAQRGSLVQRTFYAPSGYGAARSALVGAAIHNRLLRAVAGPGGGIRAFSPDGRRFLTVSRGAVILADSESGRELQRFENTEADPFLVAFSPDGVRVRTVADPFFVAFSPDGSRVLTVYWDEGVWVWDAQDGHRLGSFRGGGGSVSAALSPDARRIAVGYTDGSFRIWETDGERQLRAIAAHEGAVNAIAFSPSGQQVVTGSADRTARVWDVESGRLIQTFSGRTERIWAVAFAPSGGRVLTGSLNSAVLWDVASGRGVLGFEGHNGAIRALAFSPDGRRILTGADDRTAALWDAETGVRIAQFEELGDSLRAVAFTADAQHALTGAGDGVVRSWRLDDEPPLVTLGGHQLAAASASPRNGAWRIAAASFSEPTIRLADASNGRDLRTLSAARGVGSLAISADGRIVAAASMAALGGAQQAIVQVWDADAGAARRQFEVDGSVSAIALSSDGRLLLAAINPPLGEAGASVAQLWNAEAGETLHRLEGHDGAMSAVAISRDSRRLLTGSADRTARLWDAETGQLIHSFGEHESAVTSVAFSDDGRHALVGTYDGSARLWDIASTRALQSFRAHAEPITAVAFSSSGELVLTGSFDRTARLWDVHTGRTLQTYTGHLAEVRSVAFVADGRRVVTASRDLTVVRPIAPIVFANARDQVQTACAMLRQIGLTQFTEADRQRFPILRGEPDSPCPAPRH